MKKNDFTVHDFRYDEGLRGRKENLCPSLTTKSGESSISGVPLLREKKNKSKIRKLTPLETWRCMGFSDEDYLKAKNVCSETQLYKQAGNSIVKQVLMAIFGEML